VNQLNKFVIEMLSSKYYINRTYATPPKVSLIHLHCFFALFSGERQLRSNQSTTVPSKVCFEAKAADVPIISAPDIFPLLPVPVIPPPGQNTSSTRSEFGVPVLSQFGDRSGFDISKPEETPSVQPAPIPDLTQSYYQVSSFLRKNMESVGSKMSGVVKKGIGRE